jgi:hypothetical protein
MNARPSKTSDRQLADLMKVVQEPSLRERFNDLMRGMRYLPLDSYDLAEFLRLVKYNEVCEKGVSDERLPTVIARMELFLSRSTEELLEILHWFQAQESRLFAFSPLGPALEESDTDHEPSVAPASRVPSFHDPPGRKRLFFCRSVAAS